MKHTDNSISDIAESRIAEAARPHTANKVEDSFLALCMSEGLAPSADTISVEHTQLTPEMAAYLLERNAPNNRRMSAEHVAKLKKAMASKHWDFRADVIRISTSGILIDGQHRCKAVVETGVTVETLICYGLPDTLIRQLDTTVRPRSYADGLRVDGLSYANKLSAAAGVLYSIATDEFSSRKRPSDYEMDEMLAEHGTGLEWALKNVPSRIEPGIQAGSKEIYTIFGYFYPIDPDKVSSLLDLYVNEGAPKGHPMNTLRRTVASPEWRNMSSKERLQKTARCVEAGLRDESLSVARVDNNVLDRVRELREGIISSAA